LLTYSNARDLEWGYVVYPPVTAFLARIELAFFGTSLIGLRFFAAHRFRDTFAVELLLAGVPLERVSVLLGHQSVRITEQHYSPWVRSRQEQLEQDLRRVWEQDPIALMEPKSTPEVHGKAPRPN